MQISNIQLGKNVKVEIDSNINNIKIGDNTRIVKPQTIVLTYVPNANSFHRILALESGLIKSNYEFSENDKPFGRRHVFNLESIQFLFEQSGFATVKSDTYFIKPFTHEQTNEVMESSFLS